MVASVLCIVYGVWAGYLALSKYMLADAAAAVVAFTCFLIVVIIGLVLRLMALGEPTERLKAEKPLTANNIGTELGILVGEQLGEKVKQNPTNALILAGLAGLAAGAAPDHLATLVKAMGKSLR